MGLFDALFGSAPAAPPPPDYKGAAEAQGAASLAAIDAQTRANRINQVTPFGTMKYTTEGGLDQAAYDKAMADYRNSWVPESTTTTTTPGGWSGGFEEGGGGGWGGGGTTTTTTGGYYSMAEPDKADFTTPETWTQTTELHPDAQAALEGQLQMQKGRSQIANNMMADAEAAITTPIDYSSFSPMGQSATASNFQGMGNAPQLQTQLDMSGVPQMPGQFNPTGLPAMPTYDSAYVQDLQNQALDYMRPDMMQQQTALDARLAAQGIGMGSKAWETAQRRLGDQQARDKYQALNTAMSQGTQMYNSQLAANQQAYGQQANTFAANMGRNQQGFNQAAQAFGLGNSAMQAQNSMNMQNAGFNNQNMQNSFAQQQAISDYQNKLRQQQIAEAQMRQLQPLNNINALMTGQQVGMPQMPAFNTAGAAQPTNYLGAAQMQGQYNMDAAAMNNASANSTMQGIFNLGGQLGSAYMLSDRRLKRDIKKVGKLGKLNLYSYRYVWDKVRHIGVMADEVKKVKPSAVMRHVSGYYMVDYSQLGA